MYQIFIVCNKNFGDISKLEYSDRDLANTVWKGFMQDGNPIITVNENKFRIWNAPFQHQPEVLKADQWPQWAIDRWTIRQDDNSYLGAKLIAWDSLGCYELRHTTMTDAGMKKIDRQFFTYKGEELFSIVEYN